MSETVAALGVRNRKDSKIFVVEMCLWPTQIFDWQYLSTGGAGGREKQFVMRGVNVDSRNIKKMKL